MMQGRQFRWAERSRDAFASFRVRLVLLAILAVLPALGFILYSAAEQRRRASESVTENTLRLVQIAAADHERLIEETRRLLGMLARVPAVQNGDPAECNAFLAEVGAFYDPRYEAFAVFEPDGDLRCISIPGVTPFNVADRLYFRLAMETGAFAVGDYIVARVPGAEAVLGMAYPVLDGAGEVRMMVATGLNLEWLNRFAARATLPPGGSLTLQDRGGIILTRHPDPQEWVGRPFPDAPLLRAMREAPDEGTVRAAGIDGVERLYAFRRLSVAPVAGWVYLSIGISREAAFGEIDRTLKRDLLLLGLVSGLALLAAWVGGDLFFLRKVKALVVATERVEAGDLSARTGLPRGRGELDRLAGTFDRTAAVLQERTGALERREREAQGHLERIARLNRVYAVLSGINSALLRVQTPEELLEAACRIAVDQGNFRLATVHRVDGPESTLTLTAWDGAGPEEVERAPLAGRTGGRTMAEVALLERRHVVADDEALRSLGYGSAAAFPLEVEQEVVGVLSLYTAESDFFDDEEIRLLRDLTTDTSLGLKYLDRERRLQYLANYDPQTDLPNRALFQDRLTQTLALGRRERKHVGVLSLNIPELDAVATNWGQASADRVVRAMVEYLVDAVRRGDSLARLGSNEFGIVLVGVSDPIEIEALVARISDQAPASIHDEDQEIFVSLRIGAAVHPQDGEDGETLIQNASLARRSAVASTVAFYSPELDAEVRQRRLIENELRHAIERDELVLHYQPVVDVGRGEIEGAEALIRWRSSSLGDLGPGDFIQIAEETGLITPIGEWIIESASRQARKWHQQGVRRLWLSVNVSVHQILQQDFLARVTQILDSTGFDPAFLSLGIEITETVLMENLEDAVDLLRRFRKMGMRIYIDDFGTGYSSLSYLRRLPIDALKIDASFIGDLPSDPDAVAVVKGIVAMAHSLELRVIAEGVETEEQLAVLRHLDCDAAQGFLFSRPVPAEELEALFGESLTPSGS